MLRNFLRTSRWLVRNKINIVAPVVRCKHPYLTSSYVDIKLARRQYTTTPTNIQSVEVEPAVFEDICNETLESLCDYFEEIVEKAPNLKGADITFSDGVLTISLGSNYGTYVINRQTPNKQIWLSSPVSGPKRYDLILQNGGYWIYKHDGVTLHQLLQSEISKIVEDKVEFKKCAHSLA